MNNQKKKRKASSKKLRPYEVRDYFAKKMISDGLTIEKFDKIVGIKKTKGDKP